MSAPCAICKGRKVLGIPGKRCPYCNGTGVNPFAATPSVAPPEDDVWNRLLWNDLRTAEAHARINGREADRATIVRAMLRIESLAATVAQLNAQIVRLREGTDCNGTMVGEKIGEYVFTPRCVTQAAEIATLRQDAERIEYLETHCKRENSTIRVGTEMKSCTAWAISSTPGRSLRETIDLVRAAQQEKS